MESNEKDSSGKVFSQKNPMTIEQALPTSPDGSIGSPRISNCVKRYNSMP